MSSISSDFFFCFSSSPAVVIPARRCAGGIPLVESCSVGETPSVAIDEIGE